MTSSLKSILKFAVLAALLLAAPQTLIAADIGSYGDQAPPVAVSPNYDRYNSPLEAGQLTLQDVLDAHKPKKPVTPSTAAKPGVSSGTATSANIMLQEGMQSVLQQPATGKPVQLQPPQIGQATAAPVALNPTATVAAPVAAPSIPKPVDVSPAPGVKYEPGQQPKNLAGGKSAINNPVPTIQPSDMEMDKSIAAETPVSSTAETASGTNGCSSHVENWTKSCADAGYPDNFVGKIIGETRTACPSGALQDVWVANSCAPPGEEGNIVPAEAPQPAPRVANNPSPVSTTSYQGKVSADASCGSANGLAASNAPANNLCANGEASDVSGDGPWRWNCKGYNGGMTVSCAAPITATASVAHSTSTSSSAAKVATNPSGLVSEDGLCGASNNMGTDHAPAADLCVKGTASRVSGSGPWTWACSGENGGTAAACSASRKVDGQCGAAGKNGADRMPTEDLCTSGYASAVTGDGPWNWTCSGLYGGNPVTCAAAPKKDAVCGSASLNGHRDAPKDNLCSVGDAGYVHGGGPWNWSCSGVNGGASVTCVAPNSVDGLCGNANGVAVTSAPSDLLCAHGTPTRVVGTGPWQWNCSGSDGGNTQSCTAPVASRQAVAAASKANAETTSVDASVAPTTNLTSANASLCGPASELMALEAPDKDLCASGKASDVSGNGPWNWTCDDNGRTANCTTLSPAGSFNSAASKSQSATKAAAAAKNLAAIDSKYPTCGSANGQGATAAPVDGLCAVGKASAVKGSGPWTWACSVGKAKASCSASKQADGACGTANGSVQKYAPAKGLCSDGTPTQVEGSGPWMWSCVGSGGGASSSCSAQAQSQTRIDGSCGAAGNAAQVTTPDANLCDSGVASNVYGDGPWTWTCSGLNGGIAASCSARKEAIAAPPPPGPAVNGLCGNSNGVAMVAEPVEELCVTGTATAVSGSGPWNWNCLGANGGMTVSCTAPLQPPAPITGVCGSANGVPTLTTPRSGLCSAGISSAVSGKGPWTWSCSGTNGGGAVGCVAPLAGNDNVGSLPSLSTPSNGEAPAPMAAPTHAVTSGGLVTPQLQPAGSSPKLKPLKTPSLSGMGATPQPTPVPSLPDTSSSMQAPATPDLEDESQGVTPPPVRDNLPPSPALKGSDIDNEGAPIPGNKFKLSSDVSHIPFNRNSENINADSTPVLDKLASIMDANGGIRVTLTAFADNSYGMTPRDARRLSLQRALAIRDYLTAKGISSARIDVRALGANMPKDQKLEDRVDITAN